MDRPRTSGEAWECGQEEMRLSGGTEKTTEAAVMTGQKHEHVIIRGVNL